MDRNTAAILIQAKSSGLAALLTLMFGGMGLFYASIPGGIIMTLIEFLIFLIAILTLGLGLLLLPFLHIACMIWAMLSVNSHNRKLLARS